jgi:hypothetical protein
MSDYYDAYPNMTPEEEAAAYLADCLDEVRWPIEGEGYLEALDEQASAAFNGEST